MPSITVMKPHPAGFLNSAVEGHNIQSVVYRIHSKSAGPTNSTIIEPWPPYALYVSSSKEEWCQRSFFRWKNMKNPDKILSGKSDEREVKKCKSWFFTLHSLFFISRKTSFRTAKGKLWPRQRLCFVAWNISFRTTKRYLWRSETIPLANLYFVNREITD